jgi:exopolysaccharide production protein ExoY
MAEVAPDEVLPPNQPRQDQTWLARAPTGRMAYRVSKRALDLAVSAIGLALLSPVFLGIALATLIVDGRPLFYHRRVVGLGGNRFTMVKFRTMREGAEEALLEDSGLYNLYRLQNYKLRVDHRVTWLGRYLRKYSLDELPQLWNILRGEMSLVGPRCVPDFELLEFGDFAPLRQTVLPGLTGLWQVSGRADRTYADRIRLDRDYVLRRSFWLDVSIILRTVPAVARGVGAY